MAIADDLQLFPMTYDHCWLPEVISDGLPPLPMAYLTSTRAEYIGAAAMMWAPGMVKAHTDSMAVVKLLENEDEGKRLVFFVSAKEVLNNTVQPDRADSWSQFCDFIALCL